MTTPNAPDQPSSSTPDSAGTPDRAGTPVGPGTRPPGPDATADELVADIEATRSEMGDTAAALSEKFDVRSQARNSIDDVKQRAGAQAQTVQARGAELVGQVNDRATDDQGNLTRQARSAVIGVAAVVAGLVVGAIWRRSRR